MDGTEVHVNFDAPAVLRKWPSLHNTRRTEGTGPYIIVDGTLDECVRQFIAKPVSARHLYEIRTSPQQPEEFGIVGSTLLNSLGCEIFSDGQALSNGFRTMTRSFAEILAQTIRRPLSENELDAALA